VARNKVKGHCGVRYTDEGRKREDIDIKGALTEQKKEKILS
jgi:hypothetical protein